MRGPKRVPFLFCSSEEERTEDSAAERVKEVQAGGFSQDFKESGLYCFSSQIFGLGLKFSEFTNGPKAIHKRENYPIC